MNTELDPLKSRALDKCQLCGSGGCQSMLFVGHVPPVNTMPAVEGMGASRDGGGWGNVVCRHAYDKGCPQAIAHR